MVVEAESRQENTGWRAVLADMLVGTREAALRLPVTVAFLLLMALYASLQIESIDVPGLGASDHVMAFLAGALASLAASLFGEARAVRPAPRIAGSAVAGVAAFALMRFDATLHTYEWTFLAALAGLVPVAPFLGRGSGAAFWMFSARLAFAVFLAALTLLLFAGGISAILASLTYLFGIDVPSTLYEHVWAMSGLFAAPLFGLGQIPREFDSEPDVYAAGFMERGMRALGDFVAAPLLVVYALILHLYALKIVFTQEVPQGQIGWLVLAYGFCIFGVLIVISPFLSAARAPTRLLLRLWPFLLPVPLALLAYALVLRVGEYGVTPERFLLGLFGAVTLVVLVLQFAPRLRGDIRLMAALPAFALVLGSFGPQGALSLSLDSQTRRFHDIVADRPVEGKRHDEALSALQFLSAHDALTRVAPPEAGPKPEDENLYRWTAEGWGLDPDLPRVKKPGQLERFAAEPMIFSTDGFDVVATEVWLSTGSENAAPVELPSGRELLLTLELDALLVESGEQTMRFAIEMSRIESLAAASGSETVDLVLEDGTRRIRFIPAYLSADLAETPPFLSLRGILMLRSADWR